MYECKVFYYYCTKVIEDEVKGAKDMRKRKRKQTEMNKPTLANLC